jgi:S-(hydroxymethyl)glutathione dehydrogenase / alcohol dehydrogenase
MRAAVCYAFNEPLTLDDLEILPPRWGEVRVRLAATAICHSDIHYIQGEREAAPPFVVGHESAGVVQAVGEGVRGVTPGQRVVVSLIRSCGRCAYCIAGTPFLCDYPFPLNTESRLRNERGEAISDGALNVSGFAEEAIVEGSQVVPLPDDIPFDRACLLACGVITGVGAVVNTAGVRPGQSVVVIGAGGVGLNAVQGAVIAGAYPIIAVDMLESKLDAARRFGATHTVQVGREDALEAVRDYTRGGGADAVIVTTGSPSAVTQGLSLVRRSGSLVLVGLPGPGVTAPLPIRAVVNSGIRILGSCMGSTRLHEDVPWLIDLYCAGRLELDGLITARYPLEGINEAIASVERGEALRNVIVFE